GPEGAEFYGQLNFMKAGIVSADFVNTVSPTYAREIQTAEFGERLDGLLRSRGSKLSGILNGIDYDVWNPAKDPFLTQKYSKSTLERKRSNKTALRKEASLPEDAKAPLIGYVSRVTAQKGFAFREYTPDALLEAVRRAVGFYHGGRGWKSIVQRAMSADLSWSASARQYVALYEKVGARVSAAT